MSRLKPSKSSRKRENHELQSLGEELIDLTLEQLATIDLDRQLLDAVFEAKSITAHGALRRQKQLIGKLMRDVDPEPIRVALDVFGRNNRREKQLFREAEAWRDRLLAEGPMAVDAFFEHIGFENPRVRDQLKAHAVARHDKARRVARRRLFSEVHADLAAMMENGSR